MAPFEVVDEPVRAVEMLDARLMSVFFVPCGHSIGAERAQSSSISGHMSCVEASVEHPERVGGNGFAPTRCMSLVRAGSYFGR
jgi:hypothetical protein